MRSGKPEKMKSSVPSTSKILKGPDSLKDGKRVLEIEARAVLALVDRLDETFSRAVDLLVRCKGKVVVSGMGKSGLIGQKIAATLASTGTSSFFLHPAEGVHGDLGMLARRDLLIAISNSGETQELLQLLPYVERMGIPVIALTGRMDSTLAKNADIALDVSVAEEACPLGLACDAVLIDFHAEATSEKIQISRHRYERVPFDGFVRGLLAAKLPRRSLPTQAKPMVKHEPPQAKQPLKVTRLFHLLDQRLADDMAVVCDVGLCLFGAIDLTIHKRTEFIAPAYYTSMGFAVPAAIGAQVNRRDLRPIVFVGDGAFQMTGQELATAAKYGLNPIVFVLNNKGYTTERYIREGPYNDIHEWAYHLLPQVLRKGWGCEVSTEGELEDALATAWEHTQEFCIINVHLDKMDRSTALERLGKRLAQQAKLRK